MGRHHRTIHQPRRRARPRAQPPVGWYWAALALGTVLLVASIGLWLARR